MQVLHAKLPVIYVKLYYDVLNTSVVSAYSKPLLSLCCC